MPQCQMIMHAVSPLLVTGLTNGTTYSFTVNGRTNGGPGGPGSPSIQVTPRLAGSIWTQGDTTVTGGSDLHGVVHGSVFVAVGSNGGSFSSSDGNIWTAMNNPSSSTNLNAVTYYGGSYLAVGAGGVLWLSTDALNWTLPLSVTTNDLYAVTGNGAGVFVATGASGTIIYSSGGTWYVAASSGTATTNPLYAVTYGNGMYVAAGAAGTLLTSTDGSTWTAANFSSAASISAVNLKAVAYGPAIGTTATGIFVALGDNGTLVTSLDGGVSWVLQPAISSTGINAVTYGRQFVAVDNAGGVFTSTDGVNWSSATSPATSPLYAVTHGLYDYSAVGAAGLNMHSM